MLDRPPNEEPRHVRTLLYVTLTGLALMVLLYFVADDARRTIHLERWRTGCESGESLEACGRLALDQMRNGVDTAEMSRGLAEWERLCVEEKISRACRYTAVVRSLDKDFEWLLGDASVDRFEAGLEETSGACSDGDARACLIVRSISTNPPAVPATVTEACKRGDEPLACAAVTIDARTADRTGDPRENCRAGDWKRCAEVAPADGPHADAQRRALAVLAGAATESHVGNLGLRGVSVADAAGFADACEDGLAESCVALGLSGEPASAEGWIRPTPDTRWLKATYGRACDLGMNAACLTHAVRLLDRPILQTVDAAAAKRALEPGCERGDQRACWWGWLASRSVDDDPRDLVETLGARCTEPRPPSPAACKIYGATLAVQSGATPWVRNDLFALVRLEQSCRNLGDVESCEMFARLMHRHLDSPMQSIVIPLYDRTHTAAKIACEGGDEPGCAELVETARRRGEVGPGLAPMNAEELKAELCERDEDFCAWYDEHR